LELVRDSLKLTDADLKLRMKEIDLRDGVEDGAITTVPLSCPQCNRVSSSQHWKCIYCGMDFEEGCY
jgi:ribosomal protein L37AE/L43A